MLRSLRRVVLAAIVAGAALLGPAAAYACDGGPSAVNVYKECVPTASGNKPTSGGGQSGGQATGSNSSTPLPVSKQTARALAHAGHDKALLSRLVRSPNLGVRRDLQSVSSGSATAPSAVGAAFDLGSGPTILLALLAATAVLLLGGSGLRVWRQRHR